MIRIIKWLLATLVVLALIGGAIQFQSSDEEWSFIINKDVAFNSIQNGGIRIYDFFAEIINNSDTVTSTDLNVEKSR